MNQAKEDHRMKCIESLSAIGAATELCEFLADVLQCESDMTYATGKFIVEVNQISTQHKIESLSNILQRVYKSVLGWMERLDDLRRRKSDLPMTLNVDRSKLNQVHSFKAICSLETLKTSLREGEDVEITDSSIPDLIKVRNQNGQEGYLPLLSCFVPAPDLNLTNCIERLQVQLMTCAADLIIKLQASLANSLLIALKDLTSYMAANFSSSLDLPVIQKFKVRSLLFIENIRKEQFEMKHIARSLRILENNFIRNPDEEAADLRRMIADIDKPILFFLALKDKLRAYRVELKSSFRPIRIVKLDSKALNFDKNKPIRCYEVRLTAIETTTREERTYFVPKNDLAKKTASTSASTSIGPSTLGASKHCSVQFVVDPRTGEEISVKDAVALGILDHRSGSYIDPDTGDKMSIAAAISRGRIKVRRKVVNEGGVDENCNNIGETSNSGPPLLGLERSALAPNPSLGLVTLKTKVMRDEYEILSALDIATGCRVSPSEAERLGIVKEGFFLNTETECKVALDDAISKGWLEVDGWKGGVDGRNEEDGDGARSLWDERESTFAVEEVYDRRAGCYVSFIDGIKRRLVDTATSCVVDNVTNEKVFPSEAIERGLIKVRPVDLQSSLRVCRVSPPRSTPSPSMSAQRYLRKSQSPDE